MNAVLEACVHCGDVDLAVKLFDEMSKPESCGVDNVTYGTLLKVLFYFIVIKASLRVAVLGMCLILLKILGFR